MEKKYDSQLCNNSGNNEVGISWALALRKDQRFYINCWENAVLSPH